MYKQPIALNKLSLSKSVKNRENTVTCPEKRTLRLGVELFDWQVEGIVVPVGRVRRTRPCPLLVESHLSNIYMFYSYMCIRIHSSYVS